MGLLESLQRGDIVLHNTFGKGVVMSLGKDDGWIDFDSVGPKHLQLRPPFDRFIESINGVVWKPEPVVVRGERPKQPAMQPMITTVPERHPYFNATRAKVIQGTIGVKRRALRSAASLAHAEIAAQLKRELVALRLEFCTLIRLRTQDEREELYEQLQRAVERELTKLVRDDYSNICWACQTDVMDSSNDKCGCGWLICFADGACQCPDFWAGVRRDDRECVEQASRLGNEVYKSLVERRLRCTLEMARDPVQIRQRMMERDQLAAQRTHHSSDAWDLDDVPF